MGCCLDLGLDFIFNSKSHRIKKTCPFNFTKISHIGHYKRSKINRKVENRYTEAKSDLTAFLWTLKYALKHVSM